MKIKPAFAATRAMLAAGRLLAGLMASQFTWLITFALGGASSVSVGAYIMHGPGPAMMVAGGFSMLFAVVIFRGLGHE